MCNEQKIEGTRIKIRNLIFLPAYNTPILIPFKSLPLVNLNT